MRGRPSERKPKADFWNRRTTCRSACRHDRAPFRPAPSALSDRSSRARRSRCRPRLAISARLAPLPPSRSRRSALPSALPSPKVNTHLPAFTDAGAATVLALAATGFFAALAGLFFSALRAEADGAGLARTAVDDFDFAAVFFALATALAMTENDPLK